MLFQKFYISFNWAFKIYNSNIIVNVQQFFVERQCGLGMVARILNLPCHQEGEFAPVTFQKSHSARDKHLLWILELWFKSKTTAMNKFYGEGRSSIQHNVTVGHFSDLLLHLRSFHQSHCIRLSKAITKKIEVNYILQELTENIHLIFNIAF